MAKLLQIVLMVVGSAAVIFQSSVAQDLLPTTPRQCFAPTQCDANFASCTIGLNCMGSLITQCGFGDGSENGACQTFSDGATVYCQCSTCIGLVNSLLYNCACGGAPAGLACPSGETLVTCTPNKILGPILGIKDPQYSCCTSVNGGC